MGNSTVYIGLDVHSRTCTIAWMNEDGQYEGTSTVQTSGSNLREAVERIDSNHKLLTIEQSSLAMWTARALDEVVDQLIVCDPRANHLISEAVRKDDEADARALARLLRLGEIKEVYQPENDRRALFKQATNHYLDLRDQQRALKQKIKSRLKRWGLWNIEGAAVYSKSGRKAYLDELRHERIRGQVGSLYRLLDRTHEEKQTARQELIELGRPYREIQEFLEIPGLGTINAHVFDAFIQTPDRFATKQKLWHYCKLGIKSKSSGDKRAIEQLDEAGHGELKNVSYQTFCNARGIKKQTEIDTFYEASYRRTGDETHARLNTQRKIIQSMWALWKNDTSYDPQKLLGPASRAG